MARAGVPTRHRRFRGGIRLLPLHRTVGSGVYQDRSLDPASGGLLPEIPKVFKGPGLRQNYTTRGIIAEGIETEQELAVVREIGVDLGQGFLFGRPEALMSA